MSGPSSDHLRGALLRAQQSKLRAHVVQLKSELPVPRQHLARVLWSRTARNSLPGSVHVYKHSFGLYLASWLMQRQRAVCGEHEKCGGHGAKHSAERGTMRGMSLRAHAHGLMVSGLHASPRLGMHALHAQSLDSGGGPAQRERQNAVGAPWCRGHRGS